MYQNWREEDSKAAMTSSGGYPRDYFGTDALWDTGSFGMAPTSSSGTPYVSIPVQYPNNNGLLYQSQNAPWSAQTNDGIMDKDNYFNENLENVVEKERCNEMENANPVVYADDENTNLLEEKSLFPAYQSTSGSDKFWYSNPYKAWKDNPITFKPTEPMGNNMHQLETLIPKNIDTEELCEKLTREIHNYNICCQNFAKKVLNKHPRVLRKMLKNPKPWNELRTGRLNYIRIHNWLNLPLEKRLGILDMELMEWKTGTSETGNVDPLNASLPDYVKLDTNQLTELVAQEMNTHKISSRKFAKNRQPIQESRNANDEYNHQPLQTSTNIGSSDDLVIPDSLFDSSYYDTNDYQYENQLLHSSTIRMYNQQRNSDTENSNDQYSNQPHSSNDQPIDPYRQRSFQNGADFNVNSERRQSSHSVDSVFNKMARKRQTPPGRRSPSLDDVTYLDNSYRKGNDDESSQSTSSSSADFKAFEYYKGLLAAPRKIIDDAYRRSSGFHASSSSSDSEAFAYYEGLLAAPLANDTALDTKILCDSILQEMKTRYISQSIFATRVANRSQGTLSELLRKPKPWDSLKSGRGTYVRFFNWYQLPENQRMEIVDKKINWPVPEKKEVAGRRATEAATGVPAKKKPRTEFHPVQRSALQTIFEENPKPSADVMAHIARNLKLDIGAVENFFQNTRKRTNDQEKCKRHPPNDYQEEN
ncbi:Protein CBG19488 [Caenorhabditis briggsae]|uniref:DNA-binding protein SATB n=2 Tax=Caenorhabditis briggsae TaxID=6238 RepID=A8XVQ6_CAEBR|nr:Protein CBG19488 [Caenorhabditis briggsae]ULU07990.1 hypothetical protein L3Y34_019212 [Caenorhabditis briggsae]CAP36725.2 Protein CBG19488 [Caenorhabditis briggsae]